MGYTHDTQMSQFIPPGQIVKTAGTWTPSVSNNRAVDTRTANASAFTLIIPVQIPSNGASYKGARLKSIDLWWTAGVADFTDVNTVELEKVVMSANAAAPAGAAVTTVTIDSGNDTNAKRLTQASHTMTVTLDTPAWIDDGEVYYLTVIFNAAGGTTFVLYGARANYDLRV